MKNNPWDAIIQHMNNSMIPQSPEANSRYYSELIRGRNWSVRMQVKKYPVLWKSWSNDN